MNIGLSREALDFGGAARSAFEAAGGDELVQRAERDPKARAALVEPVLTSLGADQIQPRQSADELEAAAALCRSAGWWAVPYPFAEWLARPQRRESGGLVVIGDGRPSAAVAGLNWPLVAVDLDGRRYDASVKPSAESARSTQFIAGLELTPAGSAPARDAALALTLGCWTLLGMLDRAMALTRSHVLTREQFGQPLARLQGVQFQLTDAEVERAGLEELAKYALWSLETGSSDATADALALRLAALEAADEVLRVGHQLHGAMGFCDESTLSWISRYSQPIRRLPWGLSGTTEHLSRAAGRRGIQSLFSPSPS
jgi:hypothetical protein